VPALRDLALEVAEAGAEGGEGVVGQAGEIVAGDGGVGESGLELWIDRALSHPGGEAADPWCTEVFAKDAGQLLDEGAEVARLAAVAAAGQLGGDDVEAALHHAADVGQPGLDLLELGPGGADILDGPLLDRGEVTREGAVDHGLKLHPRGSRKVRVMTTTVSRLLLAAAAVALPLSACGGDDDGGGSDVPEGAVEVVGTDALAFEPDTISAPAGEVSLALVNDGSIPHTLVVEGFEDDLKLSIAGSDDVDSGSLTLEAGEYTYYCDVAGHRGAGMEGTLTVE
jgi:plastocyanin